MWLGRTENRMQTYVGNLYGGNPRGNPHNVDIGTKWETPNS